MEPSTRHSPPNGISIDGPATGTDPVTYGLLFLLSGVEDRLRW